MNAWQQWKRSVGQAIAHVLWGRPPVFNETDGSDPQEGRNSERWPGESLQSAIEPFQVPSCVLVGAGISYPTPSEIPTAVGVLESIFDALPLKANHVQELKQAITSSWRFGIGSSDFLRFEQVMAALQSTIDPTLTVITTMAADALPNPYHYHLARLLLKGHFLLTTNFDSLIEAAAADLGIPFSCLVTEEDFRNYRKSPQSYPNPIFKLHGSLSADGTTERISATIQAVVDEPVLSPTKWDVVMQILAARNLLVLGYSGSDSFDVMPAIADSPAELPHLLWIQHSANHYLPIYAGGKWADESGAISPALQWYVLRRLFSPERTARGVETDIRRHPEKVAVAAAPTQQVLDLLDDQPRVTLPRRATSSSTERIGAVRSFLEKKVMDDEFASMVLCGLLFHRIGLFEVAFSYIHNAHQEVHKSSNERAAAHMFACASDMHWQRGNLKECRKYAGWVLSRIDFDLTLSERMEFSRVLHQAGKVRNEPLILLPGSTGHLHELERTKKWIEMEYITQEFRLVLETAPNISPDYQEGVDSFITSKAGTASELEKEQKADYFYLRNIAGFRLECEQVQKTGLPGEQLTSDSELIYAAETYEDLQRYRKWADVTLLKAKGDILSAFPHWAYDGAVIAFHIYQKIGNEVAVEHTLEVLAEIKEKMALLGMTLADTSAGEEVRDLYDRYLYRDSRL